jgi:cytochrome oxidase Cu insertion factor (SCO1/SenC/PrrC family)
MPSLRLRIAIALTALVVLGLGLALNQSTRHGSGTQSTTESLAEGARLPTGIRPANFALTDQHGARISLNQYRGQVILLSFLSPACGPPCVLVAQQIRGALDELARPIPALAISTDPAADTPPRVARMLGEASLSARVRYLTGTVAQLALIWRSYGLRTRRSDRVDLSDSSAFVLLVDKGGFERVEFPLEELTPEGLARAIRRLQSE